MFGPGIGAGLREIAVGLSALLCSGTAVSFRASYMMVLYIFHKYQSSMNDKKSYMNGISFIYEIYCDMSVKAAGAYLWELRELRRMSRIEVAAQIREQTARARMTRRSCSEKGQPTNPAVLAAFIQIVRGKEKVDALLLDQEVTVEAGERLRRSGLIWVKSDPVQQENQRQQAVDLIEALKNESRSLRSLDRIWSSSAG